MGNKPVNTVNQCGEGVLSRNYQLVSVPRRYRAIIASAISAYELSSHTLVLSDLFCLSKKCYFVRYLPILLINRINQLHFFANDYPNINDCSDYVFAFAIDASFSLLFCEKYCICSFHVCRRERNLTNTFNSFRLAVVDSSFDITAS